MRLVSFVSWEKMIFSIFAVLLGTASIIILLVFFIRMMFAGLFGMYFDMRYPTKKLGRMEKQIADILRKKNWRLSNVS